MPGEENPNLILTIAVIAEFGVVEREEIPLLKIIAVWANDDDWWGCRKDPVSQTLHFTVALQRVAS